MGKTMGSEPLGSFYCGKKAKKRREWRGIKDTWYDYVHWLGIWKTLIGFMLHWNNLRAFFRYRWMVHYLAVPDFFDRHTEGLRGTQLRITREALELVVTDMCKSMGVMFRADPALGSDKELNDRLVVFDENMMSEIMNGFPNLKWVSVEVPAVYTCAMMSQESLLYYIDAAQQYGIPNDVCPMPAAELGVSLEDDYPRIGKCAVQCNTTCDGSLMGNGLMAANMDIPTFQLAVPIRHDEESVQQYAAEEILNAIAFIEEQTGEKFDWNAFFATMKVFNQETEHLLEWYEISRTPYPQFTDNSLSLYRYAVYMAAGGREKDFLKRDRRLTQLVMEGYRKQEPCALQMRHRAITWGVQAAYYTAFTGWLQNCWGIVSLVDMLTLCSTRMINTEDPDKAVYDLAYLYGKMIMRSRSNGGYEVGVADLWRYCEYFNVDVVIMYAHMGCKSMSGYHGLFEEEARKHGIHLIWATHGLMDVRGVSRRDMRTEVNRYMRTVLREEPLDPSLEDFDDVNAW